MKKLRIPLLVMILWGSLFPMVKLGYRAYGIVTTGDILYFAGVRFAVCGAVICLYALLRSPGSYREVKNAALPLCLSGLFAIILHYSFTYLGLSLTDSSKTAIEKQIGAILYICLSPFFFRDDHFTWRKLTAMTLGFFGILAINAGGGRITFTLGDVLIIAASLCTVASNVISKLIFSRVDPVTATGVSQLFGGLVLLLIGRLMGGKMDFSLREGWYMGYICLASVVSYCLWFTEVKKRELSGLFIIKFAEPLFACIFGAALLGEDIFKIQYLAAFLLIAAGIWISNGRKV